jgi:hypothetical protein
MITKLYGVLKITSSGEYNIYSAYLNDNLVYNEALRSTKEMRSALLNPPYEGTEGSLRNPPFTEGFGHDSSKSFGQDSAKSFAEDLESKLNLYQSRESESGKHSV